MPLLDEHDFSVFGDTNTIAANDKLANNPEIIQVADISQR